MPTKKQLHFMQSFGAINDHGSEHNAIGEYSPKPIKRPFKGKKVGEYRIVNGHLRLIPNKDL